jgi:hypothetical protein
MNSSRFLAFDREMIKISCCPIQPTRILKMGVSQYPLKDTFPIPRKTKKSLKKQMKRWLRRGAKKNPEYALGKHKYRGWYW